MMEHTTHFSHAAAAERHGRAARRRPTADAGELERMLLASAGRGESCEAVVRRLSARVRRLAHTYRLRGDDADDVAQTTWLRLLEHRHEMRNPAALGAWMHTTARRETLRVLR